MNTKPTITFLSFLLLGCAFTNVSFAEIYKWNDNQGNIRYSDIPPESTEGTNIEEVNIKNRVNTYSNDNSQKQLIENKVDTKYEQAVKDKTIEYKKQIDRSKDEDVSAFMREFKSQAAAGKDTAKTDTSATSDDASNTNTSLDINNTSNGNQTNGTQAPLETKIEPQGKNNMLPMSPKEMKQAKNCATAQENLEKLSNNNIIVAKNNKLQKLSDQQLDSQIKEAKSQIAFFC